MSLTTWPVYAALVAVHVAASLGIAPVWLQLVVSATGILYIGSIHSLRSSEEPVESLTERQAQTFPLTAGAVLAGLFFAFKLFHKDYINLLLGVYFFFIGTFAVAQLVVAQLETFMEKYARNGIKVPYLGEVTLLDVIGLVIGMAISGWYAATGHWLGNNLIAAAVCIYGIEQMSVGSFRIGAVLLIGLFFYDIIAVFYTPMMVSVAQNVTGPIKMVFIKEFTENGPQYSMLGLGDIALPGVFVALLVRFDLCMSKVGVDEKGWPKESFPQPTFLGTLVGYVLGLAVTLVVMYVYNHAQPALLYLVPAVLISSVVVATIRGELPDLLGYREGAPEEESKETSEVGKTTDTTQTTTHTTAATNSTTEPVSGEGDSSEPASSGTRQRRRTGRRRE